MPSKNMIPKGKRRQTVKPAYRAHRQAAREAEEAVQQASETQSLEGEDAFAVSQTTIGNASDADDADDLSVTEGEDGARSLLVPATAQGKRLDAFLARAVPEISRGRVQLLIENGQVLLDARKEKASYKLVGGERIEIHGEPQPAPLKAEAEDIPLTIVYEDDDLAVIDKPAGMTVHAGAGDAEHNRGTLVNALLFHLGQNLSAGSPAAVPRPGIVHRLDKETSGLIMVAKTDAAHRGLASLFAARSLTKTYLALVHGRLPADEGTVDLPIARDPVRRVRMTARRSVEQGARPAVSHWRVLERIGGEADPGPWGTFTLVEVTIETGRTHQIRVHLSALGYPVVGDTLYGAPGRLSRPRAATGAATSTHEAKEQVDGDATPALGRNFLHAAELRLAHPRTGVPLHLRAPLPPALVALLEAVRGKRLFGADAETSEIPKTAPRPSSAKKHHDSVR